MNFSNFSFKFALQVSLISFGVISLTIPKSLFAGRPVSGAEKAFCDELQNYVMKDHASPHRDERLRELTRLATPLGDESLSAWVGALSPLHSEFPSGSAGLHGGATSHSADGHDEEGGGASSPARKRKLDRNLGITRAGAFLPPLAGTPNLVRQCFSEIPDPHFPESSGAQVSIQEERRKRGRRHLNLDSALPFGFDAASLKGAGVLANPIEDEAPAGVLAAAGGGRSVCFEHHEIQSQVLKIAKTPLAIAYWSGHHRGDLHVLRQRATQSCGPTAVAMRLLDLGYPVPEEFVCQPGELTTIDWLEKHIQEKTHGRFQISKIRFRIEKSEKAEQVAGSFTYHSLEPGMGYHAAEAGSSGAAADRLDSESNPSVIHDHFIPYLERNLRQHGPVILSITDPKIEGHWIIVDEVSQADGTVRIRDPYHGRMIDVGIEAFMKRFIQDDSEKNLPEKMLWVKKPAHGGAGGSGLF